MIILIIYDVRVSVLESKSDSPIAGHSHAPMILQRSFQSMESGTGEAHIFYGNRRVESVKDVRDSLRVLSLNPTFVPVEEEPLQSFVLKALYHMNSVTLSVTSVNYIEPNHSVFAIVAPDE